MRRIALASLVLAFTIGGASAADAQQTPGTRRPRAERPMRELRGNPGQALFRGVELSDRQKDQIKAIFEKHRPSPEEIAKLRERGRELRERAREQRRNGEPRDTAAMRQRREELAQRRGELLRRMRQERAELHREVRAVLTPEQQQQFDKNVAELQKRVRERLQERRSR